MAQSKGSRKQGQNEAGAVRAAIEQLAPLDRAARARALVVLAEILIGPYEEHLQGLVGMADQLAAEQLRSAA